VSKINENREGYKETKIGWIPDEWGAYRSLKTVEYLAGAAFSSSEATEYGVRWFKISNVGIGCVKWENASYLPIDFINKYKNYLLEDQNIIMALTRPILNNKIKICKLSTNDVPSLLNQRLAKISTKSNSDIIFIYYFFQTPYFINKMNIAMAGTDPPNIGFND